MVKLVRVKPGCLDPDYADEGRAMLEDHGYLWFFVDREMQKHGMAKYRSLSTGEHYWWFDDEVEVADETR